MQTPHPLGFNDTNSHEGQISREADFDAIFFSLFRKYNIKRSHCIRRNGNLNRKIDMLYYGSLYVTLCFVLCPFDFGVLTIYFCMLSSLFVFNVAHFKRRNSRGRAKMENKRGKKDESISILIHPS